MRDTVRGHILARMVPRVLVKVSVGLATVCIALAFAAPVWAADDLEFSIRDGRVTIRAQQISIKAILEEWGRVGHTTIIDADELGDRLVTLELVDVAESRALRTLLRDAAGYLAAPRSIRSTEGSRFDRILVMADTKAAAPRAVSAVPGSRTAPPRVSPAGSGDGRAVSAGGGRAPVSATAAQQQQLEQLEQLQQLLQRPDGEDEGSEAVGSGPAFGTVPASRPGLPMGTADPNQEAAGVQTGAFGTTTPTQPTSGTRTTTIRRR